MTSKQAVLLINPNWIGIGKQKQPQFKRMWQPLDLAIAAALLEKEGFFVRILDNNVARLSPKNIGRISARFDKVFVTSTPYDRWQCPSLNIRFFFDTLAHIPKDRLYIMGAHVSERPYAILKQSRARAAILYEPEQTILDIVHRNQSTIDEPAGIDGIAWIKGNRLIRSSPRAFLQNLDLLPYPAFHLLPMEKYQYEFMGRQFAILEGSRGCPFGCNFCYTGMYGNRFRQKSLNRLIDETLYVSKRFHLKNIYYMDLEFGLNRDYILSFCETLIKKKVDINWCCQTRVVDVDRDVLKWMKRAGCSLIHFGVEAGTDRILRQTGKGIQTADCERALSLVREARIRSALFMNFGFPGETVEDMKKTIDLAIKLNPTYAAFHLIVPFPGTKLARETGVDPEAFPVDAYPHYNFMDHDLKTLKSMLKKAYLKFYFRPDYFREIIGNQKGSRFDQAKVLLRLFLG
ncbi:B12-binding domain-containing radical SAM protein [Thermodesulfobacteriota bacterium]